VTLAASTSAPHPDDTIVAVSSSPGPGARAIVRVGGPKARQVLERVFLPSPLAGDGSGVRGELDPPLSTYSSPGGEAPHSSPARGEGQKKLSTRHLVPGSLKLSGVHSPLPATLYFFRAPRSYTAQDLAELHTIGSPPLVERLVADLLDAGARPARPGEFTLRAFLAGKLDLPQAEAVNAVIEAGSDAELKYALAQLAGGVTRPLGALRDDLLNLLADLEAALDFADEDIEFVGKSETLARLDAALTELDALAHQLDERTVSGRPVRVALAGLPNAGKSSLFNALAGGAALVSPMPGTTRDYLTKRLDLGGVAVELIDTAGWLDSADTIEQQAQRLGRDATARSDVILWCDEHGLFAEADAVRLAATGAEVIRVRTKADLWLQESGVRGRESVFVSIVYPEGISKLRAVLADRVAALARPALAPSQSRCRHHVAACTDHLRAVREHVAANDPPELAAAALRAALDQLGEMTGAIYTNDLLDRIFARFCIGK
jgi:tRNA modification GTPase